MTICDLLVQLMVKKFIRIRDQMAPNCNNLPLLFRLGFTDLFSFIIHTYQQSYELNKCIFFLIDQKKFIWLVACDFIKSVWKILIESFHESLLLSKRNYFSESFPISYIIHTILLCSTLFINLSHLIHFKRLFLYIIKTETEMKKSPRKQGINNGGRHYTRVGITKSGAKTLYSGASIGLWQRRAINLISHFANHSMTLCVKNDKRQNYQTFLYCIM